MEQGKIDKVIIEQARKMGMELPEKIKNKPRVSSGLSFIWRAFWDLSTDRDIGNAEGPIPWSGIDRYGIRYNIIGDEFDRFVLLIKGIDAIYMDKRNKEHKKIMNKAKSKAKSKTPMKHGRK